MFNFSFDQPFSLIIESSDGSSIDYKQKSSEHEISVFFNSKVTISFNPIHSDEKKAKTQDSQFSKIFSYPINSKNSDGINSVSPNFSVDFSPDTKQSGDGSGKHNLTETNLSTNDASSDLDQKDFCINEDTISYFENTKSSDDGFTFDLNCEKSKDLGSVNCQQSKQKIECESESDFVKNLYSKSSLISENKQHFACLFSKGNEPTSPLNVIPKMDYGYEIARVKAAEGKQNFTDLLDLTKEFLNDLVQRQPKVHVLNLPDTCMNSNKSASEIEEIYSNLTESLFARDIEFVHRHVVDSNQIINFDSNLLTSHLIPEFQPINQQGPLIDYLQNGETLPSENTSSTQTIKNGSKLKKRNLLHYSSDESCDASDSDASEIKLQDSENDFEIQFDGYSIQGDSLETTTNSFDALRSPGFKASSTDVINTENVSASPSDQKSKLKSRKRLKLDDSIVKEDLGEETIKAKSNEEKRIKGLIEQERKYQQFHYLNDVEYKRLTLDFDDNGNVCVEVDSILVNELKQHQIEGIKFMYNSTIENVDKLKGGDKGSGCILAHCMGSGKTFQSIAFVHTILSNPFTKDHIKTILIAVPDNTLKNWNEEFNKWVMGRVSTCYEVHESNDEITIKTRLNRLDHWQRKGGVLIMGHSVLLNLLSLGVTSKVFISFTKLITEHLIDPGPDMVIIDEGHLLESPKNRGCKAVAGMKTRRKILLTGTPLQNNLDIYYTMVDVIKPRLLGSRNDFAAHFRDPIYNGQKVDSKEEDASLSKQKEKLLLELLLGSIQRLSFDALDVYLEPKIEYALFIKPTETIVHMYNFFLDQVRKEKSHLAHAIYLRFCVNHPAIYHLQESNEIVKRQTPTKKKKSRLLTKNTMEGAGLEKTWYKAFVKDDDWHSIEMSCKFVTFFRILNGCISIGDKMVVASQSTETLELIDKLLASSEQFLCDKLEKRMPWKLGQNYFRIDGLNDCERLEQINKFNDSENKEARLLLLSTKSHGIGINLTGANRLIIFDVSWNPSIDIQAICRVYRLGQTKPVYVYRFITKDTIEEQIFRKQTLKFEKEIRVVDPRLDETSIESSDLDKLYDNVPKNEYQISLSDVPKDRLLADLLNKNNQEVLECIEIDSFLQNKPEKELSEGDRQMAWIEYQIERDVELQAAKVKTKEKEREKLDQEVSSVVDKPVDEIAKTLRPNCEKTLLKNGTKESSRKGTKQISEKETGPQINSSLPVSLQLSSSQIPVPTSQVSYESSKFSAVNGISGDNKTLLNQLAAYDRVLYIRPSSLISRMYNSYVDLIPKDSNHLCHVDYLRLCVNHPAIYHFLEESIHLVNKDWFKRFVELDDCTKIELSCKFIFLFKILAQCISIEDKLVVVSQSIDTLELIEALLLNNDQISFGNHEIKKNWKLDDNYFRIDRETQAESRINQINHFNDAENKNARLLLLDTLAEKTNTNVIHADRIIIFDVSSNTNDDIQSIWSLFWLERIKPVYIHRFVTKDTMEEQIFRKQILKLVTSIRTVNKRQISTEYKSSEFHNIRPLEHYKLFLTNVPGDTFLNNLLTSQNNEVLDSITIGSLLDAIVTIPTTTPVTPSLASAPVVTRANQISTDPRRCLKLLSETPRSSNQPSPGPSQFSTENPTRINQNSDSNRSCNGSIKIHRPTTVTATQRENPKNRDRSNDLRTHLNQIASLAHNRGVNQSTFNPTIQMVKVAPNSSAQNPSSSVPKNVTPMIIPVRLRIPPNQIKFELLVKASINGTNMDGNKTLSAFRYMYQTVGKYLYRIDDVQAKKDGIIIKLDNCSTRKDIIKHLEALNKERKFEFRFHPCMPTVHNPVITFRAPRRVFGGKSKGEINEITKKCNNWNTQSVRVLQLSFANETTLIKMAIDSKARDTIETDGTISLGTFRVPIVDDFGLVQCDWCLNYGHSDCPSKYLPKRCCYCALQHPNDCNVKNFQEKWFCYFCKVEGHSAFSRDCPFLMRILVLKLREIAHKYNSIFFSHERL